MCIEWKVNYVNTAALLLVERTFNDIKARNIYHRKCKVSNECIEEESLLSVVPTFWKKNG